MHYPNPNEKKSAQGRISFLMIAASPFAEKAIWKLPFLSGGFLFSSRFSFGGGFLSGSGLLLGSRFSFGGGFLSGSGLLLGS
ncbi:MAG: hypothetical protein PVI55_01045, partial [Desulfobacterales bacterium]